jgi:hypothetical protein
MAFVSNLLFVTRVAIDVVGFRAVWNRQIAPLTRVVPPGHPLRRRLIRRMNQHATLIAGFFGPAVFRLFGQPVTSQARQNLAMIGCCIPAFDMCFDDNLMDVSRLQKLVVDPSGFIPANGVEQLATNIWKGLLESVPQRDAMLRLTVEMLETESESVLQRNPETSTREIENITRKKGGGGGLFFTTALPMQLSESELHALWLVGAWVQLVDDLFDLRADAEDSIRTPAGDAQSTDALQTMLDNWRTEAFRAVAALSLPDDRKIAFLQGFALYDKMAMRYLKQVQMLVGSQPPAAIVDASKYQAEPVALWKSLFD